MTLPPSRIAIPVFARGLTQLGLILDKGEAHAGAHEIDAAALLEARLAPDMFPLRRQVLLASDFARISVARVAGLPLPQAFVDAEATFADLRRRLADTQSFLRTVDHDVLDAGAPRAISYDVRGELRRFASGFDYLLQAAIPQFFFHVTTAYAILRHEGVALVKGDFTGAERPPGR